jgi:hypothetical protein
VIVKGGAATPEGVFAAHLSLAKSGQLWPLAKARASSVRLGVLVCGCSQQRVPPTASVGMVRQDVMGLVRVVCALERR